MPAPGPWPVTFEGLDVVSIRSLRAWTLIGVHEYEREMRQELCIDAWLGIDAREAARSDHLAHTIDYSAVAKAFREHAGGASHQLVETLAEELARIACVRFEARAACISIDKPGAVPGADVVGVTVVRRAEDFGSNEETRA